MTYFLTVWENDDAICERVPFSDYSEAIAACGKYYEPKFRGSVLCFTSEVREKRFARSYAQLFRLSDLGSEILRSAPQARAAVKHSNAFSYSKSYQFLIETEEGIRDLEWMKQQDQDDE